MNAYVYEWSIVYAGLVQLTYIVYYYTCNATLCVLLLYTTQHTYVLYRYDRHIQRMIHSCITLLLRFIYIPISYSRILHIHVGDLNYRITEDQQLETVYDLIYTNDLASLATYDQLVVEKGNNQAFTNFIEGIHVYCCVYIVIILCVYICVCICILC